MSYPLLSVHLLSTCPHSVSLSTCYLPVLTLSLCPPAIYLSSLCLPATWSGLVVFICLIADNDHELLSAQLQFYSAVRKKFPRIIMLVSDSTLHLSTCRRGAVYLHNVISLSSVCNYRTATVHLPQLVSTWAQRKCKVYPNGKKITWAAVSKSCPSLCSSQYCISPLSCLC